MIEINSKRLSLVIAEFRRLLGIRQRISQQPITFAASKFCLTISSETEEIAISYQLAGRFSPVSFTIPMAQIPLARRSGDRPIRFSLNGRGVVIESSEANVYSYRTTESSRENTPANSPTFLYCNGRFMAQMLHHAAKTTAQDSLRYSMGCIRLRGSDGQIAATDGRQAVICSGFRLPPGEYLVPARALKCFSVLESASALSIGATADRVLFRIGSKDARWSLDIRTLKSGRFPDVDRVLATREPVQATWKIGEVDAKYLEETLYRITSRSGEPQPVIIDLDKRISVRFGAIFGCSEKPLGDNGKVGQLDESDRPALNSRNAAHDTGLECVSEVSLTDSEQSGTKTRCAINPFFLQNALRQGLRDFYFRGDGVPLLSSNGKHQYVCMTDCESSLLREPGIGDLGAMRPSLELAVAG